MLVLVLSLSVAGCGGSSDYDDDIPAEARAIIRDFLASWAAEEPDARLMVLRGKHPLPIRLQQISTDTLVRRICGFDGDGGRRRIF